MNALAATAERLVSAVPHGPGTPPGSTDGMRPPPGVALAARTPWFDVAACAGHRTVRWEDGVRVGEEPMTIGTYHDLASVTKVLGTTTALMRLVSDRLVDLDTEVRRHLPGFRGGGRDGVTVRDLLLHRGGLWEWHPLYIPAGSPEEAHRFVEELPLRYRPREERHYSDLGFILLGRVIASVTGLSLEQAVSDLVTEPLGLGATRYAAPAGDPVATGARDDRIEIAMLDSGQPYPVPYRSGDFAGWRREPVHGQVADGNAYHAFGGISGHAGLFSTVPDLLRFATALSRYREHDTLIRPQVAREFFAPGPDEGQALGFRRYRLELPGETLTVLGHPGHVGCAVGFVPDRDVALALASNRLLVEGTPVPGEALWHELLTAVPAPPVPFTQRPR
ncbi:serine hydrolase domain-containing protein [Sphaerisporangium perillae]|uniref:serine hydrolase domain-containing protein n=1 Tax=Sphaerisporangium perillae TaxID=2935860 RepID=UPI00200D9D97|nr:serine hydrolase domain-containing protein [Sphaerisporangium perillae]